MKLVKNDTDCNFICFPDLKLVYVSDTVNFEVSKKFISKRYSDFEVVDDSDKKHWNRFVKVFGEYNRKVNKINKELDLLKNEVSNLAAVVQ